MPILQKILFFSWLVSAPLYLIWSRGFRGLGWACLNVFGVVMTFLLTFLVASALAALVSLGLG